MRGRSGVVEMSGVPEVRKEGNSAWYNPRGG